MSSTMLPRIGSPADLKTLSDKELEQLAAEMRDELIGVVGRRAAHFASNLGVVELCLALHLTMTARRLICILPPDLPPQADHWRGKLWTSKYPDGYPNPAESPLTCS